MKKLFQITVADEDSVVVDTGWVSMEVPTWPHTGQPLTGSALYDAVLQHGLDNGIEAAAEDT